MKSLALSRGLLCGLVLVVNCGNAVSDDQAPKIDVWYGDPQTFGALGTPQRWVNILGNVSDPDGIKALKYSVNNEPEQKLTVGPDGRRLVDAGDFNIDISIDKLVNGTNNVQITAWDKLNNQSVAMVKIDNRKGNIWPLPYITDWAAAQKISDRAQIVDGQWRKEGGGVRTARLGYDRLIAIGDMRWRDYEVTVPVMVHGVDPACVSDIAKCRGRPNVSLIARWRGHYDLDEDPDAQPRSGYKPVGAFAGFFWNRTDLSAGTLEIRDGRFEEAIARNFIKKITFGQRYLLKLRAETQDEAQAYALKLWRDGEPEPAEWDITGTQALDQGLDSGSLVLGAHHTDVTFGDATITPIGSGNPLPSAGTGEGGGGGGGYVLPLFALLWWVRRRLCD